MTNKEIEALRRDIVNGAGDLAQAEGQVVDCLAKLRAAEHRRDRANMHHHDLVTRLAEVAQKAADPVPARPS